MSKKNKKEQKNLESKPLLSSQMELLQIKLRALEQVSQVFDQRKNDIINSINVIALEIGVPENQLGEWVLSQDGKFLVRAGKQKGLRGAIRTTVKKREKKKGKSQQPEEEG